MLENKSFLDWTIKGRSGFVLYILGYFITTLVFFAIPMFLLFPIYKYFGNLDKTPIGHLILTYIPYIFPFLVIPFTVMILHRRPWWSVAMPKLFWGIKLMLVGFCIKVLLSFISVLYGYLTIPEKIIYQGFDFSIYIPIVSISTIGIFFQASAEEIYFRGYLLQVVRRFTTKTFVILLIPAFLFASRHMGNIESFGTNYISVLPYFLHAIMYGYAAIKTKSLWLPVGMHLANNLNTVALAGIKGDVLTAHTPFVFYDVPLANLTVTATIDLVVVFFVLLLLYNPKKVSKV